MKRHLAWAAVAALLLAAGGSSAEAAGHYLFAWAGDTAGRGEDFIAVIDASHIAGDHPRSKLVWQFPGSFCGVPSIVSHYLIQSVQILHAIVVLDIKDGSQPAEVARVVLDGAIRPHWTGYDASTHRLAVTGYGEDRLFMLTFNPETGALAVDRAFHDDQGNPGFDFDNRSWPHGWTGSAIAHGVVFSR